MIGRLDLGEIVDLTPADAAQLGAAALRFTESGERGADLAEAAAALVTALPVTLVRALHRYDNGGSPHNTLLVRGLLADPADLAPTPRTVTPPALGPAADVAAPARPVQGPDAGRIGVDRRAGPAAA